MENIEIVKKENGDVYEIKTSKLFTFLGTFKSESKKINPFKILSEENEGTCFRAGVYHSSKFRKVNLENSQVQTFQKVFSVYMLEKGANGETMIKILDLKPMKIQDLASLIDNQSKIKLRSGYPKVEFPLSAELNVENIFLVESVGGDVVTVSVGWNSEACKWYLTEEDLSYLWTSGKGLRRQLISL